MQPLMAYPLGFWLGHHGAVLVRPRSLIIHPQDSAVDLIVEDDLHHCGCPHPLDLAGIPTVILIPIKAWRRDIFPVQRRNDSGVGCAGQPHIEYPAHNPGSVLVDHQPMRILNALGISERGHRAKVLTADFFVVDHRLDFGTQVP